MQRLLFIFGTRPEAIKLCPVVLSFQSDPSFQTRVCVTAQHRSLLDQVLNAFQIKPDHDLDLMLPAQTLFQSTCRILEGLGQVMQEEMPDLVFVQGDTTTTLCGALAAFYQRVPVAHVEAGLRTWDLAQPFPEEMNRAVATRLSILHFAPTAQAAENLGKEGAAESQIVVTGNTGVDALLYVRDGLEQGRLPAPHWPWLHLEKRLILVTAHRRESFGDGFERICQALDELARRPDVQIVYPVHPNPNVQEPVLRLLTGRGNVHLIGPLDYVPFVDLMRRSYLILTDSGGIQEEAPSLGKPVLVLREKTERPEAVQAGTARLAGTDPSRIVSEAELLLDNPEEYRRRSRIHNPFGDGQASRRIHEALVAYFSKRLASLR
ncbi:MAG: UDP-N-acetylglucosamine 2-epimerase (non-hydrolyzing) [Acidobacteria bacterium]|nr:UDP-N-acetylglucosamine 2-epimerase (non-hydrolyzing) [Acidobacteriota bacterium]